MRVYLQLRLRLRLLDIIFVRVNCKKGTNKFVPFLIDLKLIKPACQNCTAFRTERLLNYLLFKALTLYIRFMIKVVLLGSGNVAYHLALALKSATNVELIQRYSRKESNTEFFDTTIAHTTDLKQLKSADIYILAIKDEAIFNLCQRLNHLDGLLVHTSGAMGLDVLAKRIRRGVLYPVQSLSIEQKIHLKEVPFAIEAASANDQKLLQQLASEISDHVFELDSKKREKLHVSAVFANNFSNFMFSCAEDLCKDHQIPFEILRPLILETGKKVQYMKPLDAQTGPARREDQDVIDKHLKQLQGQKREIYSLLSNAIIDRYKRE